jgi:hypothetical protein
MFSPLPWAIMTPLSTVQPVVLPPLIQYQPVISLPLNSVTGLPFTHVPSSCSLITGARSPVMVQFSLAPAVIAADKDFNGRWDLMVYKTPADKAWWLEIRDAGTGNITSMFTHAPGGLNPIENASIQNGVALLLRPSRDSGYAYQ